MNLVIRIFISVFLLINLSLSYPSFSELPDTNPTEQLQNSELQESIIENNQSIIKLQKNFIYFTITLLILIIIITFLIYKGLRTNKKLVAELRLSNQSITEKNEQLEKLVAVKDKIFSIISHDLKSPIVSLNNSLLVLKNDAVKKELKNKALESSKQQLDNTIALLNNLLDWAKTQMEDIKPQIVKVNICESITKNVKLIAPLASRKEIEIDVNCDSKLMANADVELINLVLRNLLSNAVKFTPQKGTIKVDAWSNNGTINISVTDSGIGISKNDQEKILSPDKFIKKYGTDFETGSGIGLKLCLDYIKYMDGELTITSEPEKGSTFSFTLPSH